MVASVFNKTVDEVSWEVVKQVLLRAEQYQRVVEKQERLARIGIYLVEEDRRGREHGGHIDVKPLMLPRRKVACIECVQKGMEAGIFADLLLAHGGWTA